VQKKDATLKGGATKAESRAASEAELTAASEAGLSAVRIGGTGSQLQTRPNEYSIFVLAFMAWWAGSNFLLASDFQLAW
jgi:hypothetical protein